MSKGIMLSLCDLTGNMAEPWLAAGYECWIVDLQHPPGETRDGLLVRVGADVLTYLPPRAKYVFCAAFPACTHLAVSGARWFRDKGLPALITSLQLVEACRRICEWTGAPWLLENPVGTLSTYWRDADYIFNPCDYGGWLEPPVDAYTKRTLLWTGGGLPHARTPSGYPGRRLEDAPASPLSGAGEPAQRDTARPVLRGIRGERTGGPCVSEEANAIQPDPLSAQRGTGRPPRQIPYIDAGGRGVHAGTVRERERERE